MGGGLRLRVLCLRLRVLGIRAPEIWLLINPVYGDYGLEPRVWDIRAIVGV